jgi:hypothetical protein
MTDTPRDRLVVIDGGKPAERRNRLAGMVGKFVRDTGRVNQHLAIHDLSAAEREQFVVAACQARKTADQRRAQAATSI